MNLRDAMDHAYDRYYENPQRTRTLKAVRNDGIKVGGIREEVELLEQHFEIQQAVRPLFGKGQAVAPTIGHHPDFEHLKASAQTEFAPTTTLFMDMEGSTRLGLIYSPEEVFRIKNAVIQATIDIIKSFDGHVHRIMGDAVMAYFGRRGGSVEQGAIDAINCAATLCALVSDLVARRYPEMQDEKFGIRVGVDHGRADSVLWGAYGYPGMEEVTATSFFVDVASKLQHSAGRNQIMLGQSICELLDIPHVLLSRKKVIDGGEAKEEPYVLPNYRRADGRPVNYKKYVLDWEKYLRCTRLACVPGLFDDAGTQVQVKISVATERSDVAVVGSYHPCAAILPKGRELKFDFQLPMQPRVPFEYHLRVENHGDEAAAAADNGNHSTDARETKLGRLTLVHWESTKFRGLHYLDVHVNSHGERRLFSRFGIWIE